MMRTIEGGVSTRAISNFIPMGGAESRGGAIGGIENRSNFGPMGGHEV